MTGTVGSGTKGTETHLSAWCSGEDEQVVIVFRNLLDTDDLKSSGRVYILAPEEQPAELRQSLENNFFFSIDFTQKAPSSEELAKFFPSS